MESKIKSKNKNLNLKVSLIKLDIFLKNFLVAQCSIDCDIKFFIHSDYLNQ